MKLILIMKHYEIIGTIMVIIESGAIFCLRTNRVKSDDFVYLFTMTFACLVHLYTLYYDWNLTMFIGNICWLIYDIFCIWRKFYK